MKDSIQPTQDEPTAPPQTKIIASVTLRLVENRGGVRYCDTVSSLDESAMTPYDVAKFQFHCFHCFAALHEIVIRKLVHANGQACEQLNKHQAEIDQLLKQLNSASPFASRVPNEP